MHFSASRTASLEEKRSARTHLSSRKDDAPRRRNFSGLRGWAMGVVLRVSDGGTRSMGPLVKEYDVRLGFHPKAGFLPAAPPKS